LTVAFVHLKGLVRGRNNLDAIVISDEDFQIFMNNCLGKPSQLSQDLAVIFLGERDGDNEPTV
jgi:hypothetical protein